MNMNVELTKSQLNRGTDKKKKPRIESSGAKKSLQLDKIDSAFAISKQQSERSIERPNMQEDDVAQPLKSASPRKKSKKRKSKEPGRESPDKASEPATLKKKRKNTMDSVQLVPKSAKNKSAEKSLDRSSILDPSPDRESHMAGRIRPRKSRLKEQMKR